MISSRPKPRRRSERTGIELLQAADDFGLALGPQHRAVGLGGVLGLAHFLRGASALRQQVEDLRVERIDAVAQRRSARCRSSSMAALEFFQVGDQVLHRGQRHAL